MKSARLRNGDFVLSSSGEITMATGSERLIQELTCWLLESMGTDPVNSKFGSLLAGMIGTAILSGAVSDIKTEITRVINNYIAYQNSIMSGYTFDSTTFLKLYTPDEILSSVENVAVVARQDAIVVTITIRTLSGNPVSISQTLS